MQWGVHRLVRQSSQVITGGIVVNTICHTKHSMTNLKSRRILTDSFEKQAVEKYETKETILIILIIQ